MKHTYTEKEIFIKTFIFFGYKNGISYRKSSLDFHIFLLKMRLKYTIRVYKIRIGNEKTLSHIFKIYYICK